MGSNRATVSVLPKGMVSTDPVNKYSYIQNLYKNKGNFWESRDGFGTIARFNCSLSAIPWVNNTDNLPTELQTGYEQHLGSHFIRTDFGHDQIISVFLCKGFITGDNASYPTDPNRATKKSDYVPFYAVSIYDITTNDRYETILYSHTGESRDQTAFVTGRTFNDKYLHGFYETRKNTPGFFQRVILAEPSEFWFHEYQDRVIFGSKNCPTYVYDPIILSKVSGKFIKNALNDDEINDAISNPTSEESVVTPLNLKDGPLSDGYAYLQDDDLPKFVDATTIANRVVYAAGKTLYFADANLPNAIIGDEFYTLDLEDDIVAIQNWNNNIIVWTSFEMQLYQPSLTSQLMSLGGAIPVSNKVGCLGPKNVQQIDNGVYWVDHNGVYFTPNGLKINELTESIGMFFTDYITNPISHYYVDNGLVANTSTTPNYQLNLSENTRLTHLIYDQKYQQLIFVVPELSIAWVLKNGWYLWNFETNAVTQDEVSSQAKLDPVYLLTRDENIYAIGSEVEDTIEQPVWDEGLETPVLEQVGKSKSFAVLEWKRGGALDGSVKEGKLEDWRGTHGYQAINSQNVLGVVTKIYFDKLQSRSGLLGDLAIERIDINPSDKVYLLPIRLTPNNSLIYNMNLLELDFVIDNPNFEPLVYTGTTNVVALLPTRRTRNLQGWGIGAPAAGSEVTWDAANKKIVLRYDHANVTSPTYNGVRLSTFNKNDLIYIALRAVGTGAATNSVVSQITNFSLTVDAFGDPPATYTDFEGYVYQQGIHTTNQNTAQAVDWIMKPNYIGLDEYQQIKSRGTYNKVLSHGVSTEPVVANWNYGLVNQLVGSDYKDYTTQVIDVGGTTNVIGDNITNIVNKTGIRNRITDSTGALTTATFNNSVNYDDNYLVRASEFNTLSTSDGTRGSEIAYTFFGYLKNKAEKIIIAAADAVVFAVGGKRRRGRNG